MLFSLFYCSSKSDCDTKDVSAQRKVDLDKELTAREEPTITLPKEEPVSVEFTYMTDTVAPTTNELYLHVDQLFANADMEQTTLKTINQDVANHFGLSKDEIKRRKKQIKARLINLLDNTDLVDDTPREQRRGKNLFIHDEARVDGMFLYENESVLRGIEEDEALYHNDFIASSGDESDDDICEKESRENIHLEMPDPSAGRCQKKKMAQKRARAQIKKDDVQGNPNHYRLIFLA